MGLECRLVRSGVGLGWHRVTQEGGKKSIHYVAGEHLFEIGDAFEVSADAGDPHNKQSCLMTYAVCKAALYKRCTARLAGK